MPLTASQKRYREANRAKVLACSKKIWPAYYAKNSAKYKERARQQRFQDPAAYKEAVRKKWLNRNPQKTLEDKRKWREENRDKIRAYAEAWRNKNRARYRKSQQKHYAALKAASAVNLDGILSWMQAIYAKKSVACYYCEKVVPTTDIHFDHIIALANGGPHCVENLCVTCQFCNLSKGAKPLRTWIRMGQQILEL